MLELEKWVNLQTFAQILIDGIKPPVNGLPSSSKPRIFLLIVISQSGRLRL